MAGVVLSESGVREEIEQRFFAVRDVFAALFFFVFALTIDLGSDRRRGVDRARRPRRDGRREGRRRVWSPVALGGFSARRGLNAGAALVAHGEFTIIIAQLAVGNAALACPSRRTSRRSPVSTSS